MAKLFTYADTNPQPHPHEYNTEPHKGLQGSMQLSFLASHDQIDGVTKIKR